MCWSLGSVLALLFWCFQGLLTPAIAGIAVYIAWQQKNIAQQQREATGLRSRWDLFDRRVQVLDEVRKLIGIVFEKADVDLDAVRMFASKTLPAQYLFGTDISDYVGQLYTKGLTLWRTGETLRGIHQGASGNPQKVLEEQEAAISWFLEQKPIEKFRPYLDLSKL